MIAIVNTNTKKTMQTISTIWQRIHVTVCYVSILFFLITIFTSCEKVDKSSFDPNEIHIVCKTGGNTDYNFKMTEPIDAYRNGDSYFRIDAGGGYFEKSFDIILTDSPIVAKTYILIAGRNSLSIKMTTGSTYNSQSGKVTITEMDTIQHKIRGTFSARAGNFSNELLDIKEGDFYLNYTQH